MERLVFFGKGGSGKTTVAANLSTVLAREGKRVLHVGCDPKRDSLFCLVDAIPEISALDKLLGDRPVQDPADLLIQGRAGMDCIDTGGFEAGLGCGGRGVLLVVEAIERGGLLDGAGYDAAVFDVLGDLVCGGFTAPLRPGIGEKVMVVCNGDLLSLFAANSICKAIDNYHDNGVRLAGFVCNAARAKADRERVARFAARLSTQVLLEVPRSPLIRAAEAERLTVVEHRPRSRVARLFGQLARTIADIDPQTLPRPTPMDDVALVELVRSEP